MDAKLLQDPVYQQESMNVARIKLKFPRSELFMHIYCIVMVLLSDISGLWMNEMCAYQPHYERERDAENVFTDMKFLLYDMS